MVNVNEGQIYYCEGVLERIVKSKGTRRNPRPDLVRVTPVYCHKRILLWPTAGKTPRRERAAALKEMSAYHNAEAGQIVNGRKLCAACVKAGR